MGGNDTAAGQRLGFRAWIDTLWQRAFGVPSSVVSAERSVRGLDAALAEEAARIRQAEKLAGCRHASRIAHLLDAEAKASETMPDALRHRVEEIRRHCDDLVKTLLHEHPKAGMEFANHVCDNAERARAVLVGSGIVHPVNASGQLKWVAVDALVCELTALGLLDSIDRLAAERKAGGK